MARSASGAAQKQHWLERQHPDYARHIDQWRYARDVYTGCLLEPEKLPTYLLQKAQGEHNEAFKERMALADFSPYFANVVDGFAGMIANVEDQATRTWVNESGVGLGDPKKRETIIGALYERADNAGRGWLSVWDELAVELGVVHGAWLATDTVGERRAARVNVIPREAVPQWRRDRAGALLEVLVEEQVDTNAPITEGTGAEKLRQFVHYRLEGELTLWTRYLLNTETKVAAVLDEDLMQFEAPDGTPALPVFDSTLLMKRPVGYLIARKNVSIFNKQSELDHLLRACGFPKLVWPSSTEDFKKVVTDLMKGINVYNHPKDATNLPAYVVPSSESASILINVIKEKVEALYVTAAKEYGDAARAGAQRTATQVKQDVAAGAGAYLHALKVSLDTAENSALWRVEQLVRPHDRKTWFIATVERSNDFLPPDPEAVVEAERKRVFGDQATVPLGLQAKVESAKRIARNEGLPVDDGQITAEIQARELTAVLESAGDVPVPASVRAKIVALKLTALGITDAGAEAAARELAEAQDERAALEAQTFPRLEDGGGEDDDEEDDGDPEVDPADKRPPAAA